MSRTAFTGPVAGAYVVATHPRTAALAVSGADQLLAVFSCPFDDARLVAVRLRLLNAGTGTITAHKVRRAAAGNAVVTAAGTQVLSADGGAIAANAQNAIEPSGTTPTLLSTQRDFAKGAQIGVFATTDAGTANAAAVEIVWYAKGHATVSGADD